MTTAGDRLPSHHLLRFGVAPGQWTPPPPKEVQSDLDGLSQLRGAIEQVATTILTEARQLQQADDHARRRGDAAAMRGISDQVTELLGLRQMMIEAARAVNDECASLEATLRSPERLAQMAQLTESQFSPMRPSSSKPGALELASALLEAVANRRPPPDLNSSAQFTAHHTSPKSPVARHASSSSSVSPYPHGARDAGAHYPYGEASRVPRAQSPQRGGEPYQRYDDQRQAGYREASWDGRASDAATYGRSPGGMAAAEQGYPQPTWDGQRFSEAYAASSVGNNNGYGSPSRGYLPAAVAQAARGGADWEQQERARLRANIEQEVEQRLAAERARREHEHARAAQAAGHEARLQMLRQHESHRMHSALRDEQARLMGLAEKQKKLMERMKRAQEAYMQETWPAENILAYTQLTSQNVRAYEHHMDHYLGQKQDEYRRERERQVALHQTAVREREALERAAMHTHAETIDVIEHQTIEAREQHLRETREREAMIQEAVNEAARSEAARLGLPHRSPRKRTQDAHDGTAVAEEARPLAAEGENFEGLGSSEPGRPAFDDSDEDAMYSGSSQSWEDSSRRRRRHGGRRKRRHRHGRKRSTSTAGSADLPLGQPITPAPITPKSSDGPTSLASPAVMPPTPSADGAPVATTATGLHGVAMLAVPPGSVSGQSSPVASLDSSGVLPSPGVILTAVPLATGSSTTSVPASPAAPAPAPAAPDSAPAPAPAAAAAADAGTPEVAAPSAPEAPVGEKVPPAEAPAEHEAASHDAAETEHAKPAESPAAAPSPRETKESVSSSNSAAARKRAQTSPEPPSDASKLRPTLRKAEDAKGKTEPHAAPAPAEAGASPFGNVLKRHAAPGDVKHEPEKTDKKSPAPAAAPKGDSGGSPFGGVLKSRGASPGADPKHAPAPAPAEKGAEPAASPFGNVLKKHTDKKTDGPGPAPAPADTGTPKASPFGAALKKAPAKDSPPGKDVPKDSPKEADAPAGKSSPFGAALKKAGSPAPAPAPSPAAAEAPKESPFGPRKAKGGGSAGGSFAPLLQWAQGIAGAVGVKCNNFTSDWRDGKSFLACVSALVPGKIDMTKENEGDSDADAKRRLTLAFKVAADAGVSPLLEADDVLEYQDDKSIIMYLSELKKLKA